MPSSPQSSLKPGRLFIDGEWVASLSGATFTTINPATEQPLVEVSEARAEDIDRAVQAARRAFDGGGWSRVSASQRGRVPLTICGKIEARSDQHGTPSTTGT